MQIWDSKREKNIKEIENGQDSASALMHVKISLMYPLKFLK